MRRPGTSTPARVGPTLWMLCVQFFIAEQWARQGWVLPYSFRRNYISDLGATLCTRLVCSPLHAVMNVSFALQGVLIAGGALLLWSRRGELGRAGPALLIACGAGVLVVGFVPENGNMQVHAAAAALHFLGGGLGILLIGLRLRAHGAAGWLSSAAGWLSVATGITVIAATVLLGQRDSPVLLHFGIGLVERVAAYGIAGWMVAMGAFLRASEPPRAPAAGARVAPR